jgi:3-oxoacyl-[acyl-carrier-protein] synthase II
MNDRVVITGAGMVCSLGHSLSQVWNALLAERVGIGEIKGFRAEGFPCRVGAQVEGLTPHELGIQPRDSRIMDLHTLMLMKCSRDAYAQAGLDRAQPRREEIGFFAGMGMVDYRIEDLLPGVANSLDPEGALDYEAFFVRGYQTIYPLWPLSMLNNIGFCQVAIHLDIRGENTVFSPHADSGAQAVAEGMNALLEGRSQVVLAGGVSEKISPASLARGHHFGILNTSGEGTARACQPFGADRKGTILGEGCGVVCLELEAAAKKRGIPGLAAVTGYGFAYGRDGGAPAPSAKALRQSMAKALERANLGPADIDVIVAHGEGTERGDRNELEAIHHLFANGVDRVTVVSSKGALGHLLAGAPVVDMILGLSMLKTGLIPPTQCSRPDPAIRFRVANQGPLPVHARRIMINCQSCEGQAGSLIIESCE